MPLTVDSPSTARQQLPAASADRSSHATSDAGSSSASDLASPMGSSMRFTGASPMTPLSGSFNFDKTKSPEASESRNLSNIAVQGTSPPGSANLKNLKVGGIFGKPLRSATGLRVITEPVLREEPAELEQELAAEADDIDMSNLEEQGVRGSPIDRKDTAEVVQISNDRVIAIDFDDVCSQYIPALAAHHNAKYGTNITAEDFKTYVFFQNKGWGTPAETQRKLHVLDSALPKTLPVPGFAAALKEINALGHPIHVVTARPEMFKSHIEDWLRLHGVSVGPGDQDTVVAVWCCSSYSKEPLPERRDTASGIEEEEALNKRLLGMFGKGKSGGTKLKVLKELGASLFIDDNYGNIEPMIAADPPIPCILFGDYPWNQSRSVSGMTTPGEKMSFAERTKAGLEITVEDIEMGMHLTRVKGWAEIVRWVKEWDRMAMAGDDTA